MLDNVDKLKKEVSITILNSMHNLDVPLKAEAIGYFEKELKGEIVLERQWRDLTDRINDSLPKGIITHLNLAVAITLQRALSLSLGVKDLDIITPNLTTGILLKVANHILPKVAHILPKVPLASKIFNEGAYYLDMNYWKVGGDSKNLAVLAVEYYGEAGHYLNYSFGTTIAAAIIFFHAVGDIPDFYCTESEALEWVNSKIT